jgi:hypothetical protein
MAVDRAGADLARSHMPIRLPDGHTLHRWSLRMNSPSRPANSSCDSPVCIRVCLSRGLEPIRRVSRHDLFVRRHCPVIPVLLPGVERPELPAFLDSMTWVDLATDDPYPIDQLEWGITGRPSGSISR